MRWGGESLRLSLVPLDRRFFELFAEQGRLVKDALAELSLSLANDRSGHETLRELEHRCDSITHEIYNLANRTFAPPIDAADTLSLAHSLDQVVDLAEEFSDKIDVYEVRSIADEAKSMSRCLARAGECLASALDRLIDFKDLAPGLEEVHRLENEGDRITRQAMQALLNGNHRTAAEIIKWKDLYALLESTMDECESVAEIMETMTIKNG